MRVVFLQVHFDAAQNAIEGRTREAQELRIPYWFYRHCPSDIVNQWDLAKVAARIQTSDQIEALIIAHMSALHFSFLNHEEIFTDISLTDYEFSVVAVNHFEAINQLKLVLHIKLLE